MEKRITIPRVLNFLLKLVALVVFLFPFYWMIITGMKTYKETVTFPPSLWPKEIQWQNYVKVWNSGPYWLYLKNSILVSIGVIALETLLMIPAAYSFARYKFKAQGFLFALVMLAFMVPGQVTFISIYHMMSRWKLLRTLWAQILPCCANAFGVFLLRQHFKQIPEELIESARLDNANEAQVILKIMLPMAKPTLISIMMLSFIGTWNDYFWPFIMSATQEVYTLTIGIAALRDVEGSLDWHIIMAGNTILVLPIMIIYLIFHRQIVNAFAYNGIK